LLSKRAFGQTPASNPASATLSLLEAARYTLVNNPQLHLQQQQVEIYRGQAQQAAGAFDFVFSSNYQQGHTYEPLTFLQELTAFQSGIITNYQGTNLATFNVGGQKLFRNGIEISPVIQGSRTVDNLTNLNGTNRASSDFNISFPLLRNRGEAVVDAQETAARLQINAGVFDLRQNITDLLAAVASAYWQYVAALANLHVALGSEERGRTIVQNMQELINADREPRSEINEANANLADRAATRILAEQQVVQAQQALAVTMGLSVNEFPGTARPSDDFLSGENLPEFTADPATTRRFIQQALDRRADIKANATRVNAARVQQVAAANQLKPALNLTLTAGASGLAEGTNVVRIFESPAHSVRGLDLTGGISFSFPPTNNVAKGQLIQANATIRQAEIAETQAKINVTSAVVVALNGLRHAQASLVEARRSVDAFQQSLQDQREKLRLGVGSVVDLLTVEDRLTSALTTQVQAQLNYALALTQLRQATGTIIDANQTSMTVDRDVFFTVPFGGRP
jgi:outer membrane protein TolC